MSKRKKKHVKSRTQIQDPLTQETRDRIIGKILNGKVDIPKVFARRRARKARTKSVGDRGDAQYRLHPHYTFKKNLNKLKSLEWARVLNTSVPPDHSHGVAAVVKDKIVLSGGQAFKDSVYKTMDTIHSFEPSKAISWTQHYPRLKRSSLDNKSDKFRRCRHSAIPLNDKEILLCFGRRNFFEGYIDEDYVATTKEDTLSSEGGVIFNIEDNTWRNVDFVNSSTPRSGHKTVILGSNAYFIGGHRYDKRKEKWIPYNDIVCLNLKNMTWETLKTTGLGPKGGLRIQAVGVDDLIYVLSYEKSWNTMPSLFVLNTEKLRWVTLSTQCSTDTRRLGVPKYYFGELNSFYYKENIILIAYPKVWLLDLRTLAWSSPQVPCKDDDDLSQDYFVSSECVVISDTCYIIGGWRVGKTGWGILKSLRVLPLWPLGFRSNKGRSCVE